VTCYCFVYSCVFHKVLVLCDCYRAACIFAKMPCLLTVPPLLPCFYYQTKANCHYVCITKPTQAKQRPMGQEQVTTTIRHNKNSNNLANNSHRLLFMFFSFRLQKPIGHWMIQFATSRGPPCISFVSRNALPQSSLRR